MGDAAIWLPLEPTETVDITPKVVSTVPIPALTSKPSQMAAPPPSLPEPQPLPAKPTKPSKWWMLLHSSHRDRAGGRRITVSTSAMDLVQELQKTVDELAGAPRRPSRSKGGQHHAVVTPRVEASPDRSDFAKLGETIALEQAKQFADDIRSQVAEKSRELAEMNERLMAFGDLLLAADRKFLGSDSAEVQQHQNGGKQPAMGIPKIPPLLHCEPARIIARLECPGLGG